jgi:SHAQKYF class myb-like DNA-binding protein
MNHHHHHHEDDVDLFNTASHNHEPLFGTTGDGWSLDNISTTTTATTTPSILIEQTSPPPVSSNEDEHTFQFKDVDNNSTSTSDITSNNSAIISEPSSPTSTTSGVNESTGIIHTQLNAMHPLHHPIHPLHHPIHHHLLNDLPSTSSTTAPPLSLTPQHMGSGSNSTNSILTIPSSSSKKRSRSPSASGDDSDYDDDDINSPKKSRNQHQEQVDGDLKLEHSDIDAHHDLFHSMNSNSGDSLSMMMGDHDDESTPSTPSSKKKKKLSSSQKKKRLTWTPELHTLFIEAVNQLGLNNAAPKTIHQYMNVPFLTTEHIKSHLQKYRLQMKKQNKSGKSMVSGAGGGNEQPEVSEDAGTASERRGQPSTPTPATTPHMHSFNTTSTSTATPTTHLADPNKSPFTSPQTTPQQSMFGMNTMMPGTVFIPQQIQQTLQSDDPSNMDNYQLILTYMAKEDREIGRLYDEAQRQITTADSYRLMLTGFKMGLLSAAKFPADSSFNQSPTQTEATTPTMRMQPAAKELVSSPFGQPANPWASPYITRGSTVGNSQDSTSSMNNPTRIQLKQNNQPYTGYVTMNDPQTFYMPTSTNQQPASNNNFNTGNNRGTKIEISQLNGSTQFMSDPTTSGSYNRMPTTQPFITLFGGPTTGYDTNTMGGSNRMQISQHTPASNQT